MLEGIAPQAWLDLTFGLTEGWWKAAGGDARSDYPLLPVDRWLDMLRAAGFEEPAEVSASRDIAPYALIAAARPTGAPEHLRLTRRSRAVPVGVASGAARRRTADAPRGIRRIGAGQCASFEHSLDTAMAAPSSGRSRARAPVPRHRQRAEEQGAERIGQSRERVEEEAIALSVFMLVALRAVARQHGQPGGRLFVVTRGARVLPTDAGDNATPTTRARRGTSARPRRSSGVSAKPRRSNSPTTGAASSILKGSASIQRDTRDRRTGKRAI